MTPAKLELLPGEFTIHRLAPADALPPSLLSAEFVWIARTDEELSIVCRSDVRLPGSKSDAGWSCLKVLGPMDLTAVGVLASLCGPLASANISVFALSTYDTDYLLTKSRDLHRAVQTLVAAGHDVASPPGAALDP